MHSHKTFQTCKEKIQNRSEERVAVIGRWPKYCAQVRNNLWTTSNREGVAKDSLVSESLPSCPSAVSPVAGSFLWGLRSRTPAWGYLPNDLGRWQPHKRNRVIESELDLHSQGPEGCANHVGLKVPFG